MIAISGSGEVGRWSVTGSPGWRVWGPSVRVENVGGVVPRGEESLTSWGGN